MRYTIVDTERDVAAEAVPVKRLSGSRDDSGPGIWPFERMHTWQPFEKDGGTPVYTHLWVCNQSDTRGHRRGLRLHHLSGKCRGTFARAADPTRTEIPGFFQRPRPRCLRVGDASGG